MIVRPVRFSDDVPAMRRFLAALGLAPRIESDGGGWVDLVAPKPGLVAVHDAATSAGGYPSGSTTLSFESDEPLEAVRDRLQRAGFADAHVIDEAYGRVLHVTDPDGVDVVVDEASEDLYGYRRIDRTDA